MAKDIKTPDDYFKVGCGRCNRYATADCSTQKWASGLATIRDLCLDLGLSETLKWSHPCYMHAGRNVVIFGAFFKDFRLNFFQASLLRDPLRLLQKRGKNSHVADMLSFDHPDQVIQMKDHISELLRDAINVAASGKRVEKRTVILERPEVLVDIFSQDPLHGDAFDALTPGRQKSYILHVNSAKNEETKRRRILSSREKILAGKGALER